MAPAKKPKRSPKKGKTPLAAVIIEFLAENNMTQKEFAAAANLSESMVSRIIRDSHSKGNTFKVDLDLIDQLALTMKMGTEGRDWLLSIINPKCHIIVKSLDNKIGVHLTNICLEEENFPILGEKNIIK